MNIQKAIAVFILIALSASLVFVGVQIANSADLSVKQSSFLGQEVCIPSSNPCAVSALPPYNYTTPCCPGTVCVGNLFVPTCLPQSSHPQ
ncbi:transmembrane protein, putative (macronuclear) [Tetrahymena thermophila SB210]|uniref:Transmembrane protein, putative n=1 Tax=Tetrahymena thermophila (strain SB210) TaxID=312017 RepID=W7X182_TETTS|nr:transmembrane protein, putative [Tetrahymena thermophila SB210]EWS72975.1 transmembrane protein, putative [Tetrahymena thermophila SB210]|eukprot:XP_012654482.1 transmembrane protein, putative [Tetrahymena thermophila SB210]